MDTTFKIGIWRQFGATIEYLENTITACPDHLWHHDLWDPGQGTPERAQVWYVAYHTLFWLDLYLTGTEEGFVPPAPFTLIEQWGDDPMPERPYTKAELLDYLQGCRTRTIATIQNLTDEIARRRCEFAWGEVSFFELLIYNLRHVQEHSGQINMLLGQHGIPTADYPTLIKNEIT